MEVQGFLEVGYGSNLPILTSSDVCSTEGQILGTFRIWARVRIRVKMEGSRFNEGAFSAVTLRTFSAVCTQKGTSSISALGSSLWGRCWARGKSF